MAKDFTEKEIKIGDVIAVARRTSSTVWLDKLQVTKIDKEVVWGNLVHPSAYPWRKNKKSSRSEVPFYRVIIECQPST